MHPTRTPAPPTRRACLLAGAALLPWPLRAADEEAAALIRRGGLVVALRHALAPGTFDPPGFRLDDCRTQRNLNDEGRAQARRTGQWFAGRGLRPREVRTSPWCRCRETATLAFGRADVWPALGSPRGHTEATNDAHLAQLRQALQRASAAPGFEVWVTHMFVLQALVGQGTASGEALLLRATGDTVDLLGRLQPG